MLEMWGLEMFNDLLSHLMRDREREREMRDEEEGGREGEGEESKEEEEPKFSDSEFHDLFC